MLIEEAIRAKLIGDTTVAEAVGARVYPIAEVPQGITGSYIVYARNGRKASRLLSGAELFPIYYTLSIACYNDNYAVAKGVAEAVKAALCMEAGGVFDILEAEEEGEGEGEEPVILFSINGGEVLEESDIIEDGLPAAGRIAGVLLKCEFITGV